MCFDVLNSIDFIHDRVQSWSYSILTVFVYHYPIISDCLSDMMELRLRVVDRVCWMNWEQILIRDLQKKKNRKKNQHDPTPPSKLIALSNSKLNSLPHTNDFKSQGLRSEGFLIPFMEMKYHSFIKQTLFPFMLITEKKGALLSYASRFSLAAFSLHYTAVPTQCPTAD